MAFNRCIKNLLKLIAMLQDNSVNNHVLENGCTKPFLGPNATCICYNTRVISLYNKNGNLFSTNYVDSNNVSQSSSLFRVQTVNDDTVNLLILREDNGTYYSTNTFITVKIGCICAIKCVIDTTVEFG